MKKTPRTRIFDGTLATMPERPHVIGVGHAECRIPTTYPKPHDIPIDVIVTDEGILLNAA
jgi:5-formyltetrahydrofolate cyclo-ligase